MGRGVKKKARDRAALRKPVSAPQERAFLETTPLEDAENAMEGRLPEGKADQRSQTEIQQRFQSEGAARHIPVLFRETLASLPLVEGGRYLDGTLGMGGHAEGLLLAAQAAGIRDIRLLGLDRDAEALALAAARLRPFEDAVTLLHCRFSELDAALDASGFEGLDGALADIGVSSLQLDEAERGFSFAADGPLDMRMDQGQGQSARALVNRASVAELKRIIEEYGEDPMAGRIARAIDDARSTGPIESTGQLARIVEMAYPAKWRATARNHPATRTFQALRMVVNEELEELRRFLACVVARLRPGGRVAVITFHSLEDRIVKHFFREQAAGAPAPFGKEQPPMLRVVTRKPILPEAAEVARNSRAASAKLRVAEKLFPGELP